ncbi:MAG: WG repeat-containing protein [Saprospiraceae bacterium]|nr:WG repeat-containing protein [Saprospiraceae bacterium]
MGNLYGYINRQGEPITEIKYENWREFNEDGLAFVSDSEYGWTVIDTLGNYINRDKDFFIEDVHFNEFGLVRISKEKEKNLIKYGYADKKGNIVIPLIYDRIESFYNHPVTGAGILQKNGLFKYILIDTAGNQIGDVKFDHIHYYYGGGVSMVTTSYFNSKTIDFSIKLEDIELNYELLTGKMGVIDTLGNLLIPVIYDKLSPEYCYEIDDYFKGQCIFEAQKSKNDLTGVVNDKGEAIVPSLYTFISIRYLGDGIFYGEKSESEESFYDTKTQTEIELKEFKLDKQIRIEPSSHLLVFKNKSNPKRD